MVAAHTPGPWLAERETDGYASGLSHWQIRALEEPDDGPIVAAVITDIDELRAAGAANARLIAAAPELLERLQIVTDTLASLKGEDWETIKRAREVIAKALQPQPRDQQSAGDKSREEP